MQELGQECSVVESGDEVLEALGALESAAMTTMRGVNC